VLKKLLVLLVILSVSVVGITAQDTVCTSVEDYASFLDTRYGVSFEGEVTQADFVAAAEMVAGEAELPEALDMEGFSAMEAALVTLYYANLDEIALTYSAEKITETVAEMDLDESRAAELSVAYDTGLLEASCAEIDMEAALDAETATYLLGRLLVVSGQYEYSLGMVSDPDIYNRVYYIYNSFDQVLMPDLQASANQLIRDGVITGYNVKRSSLAAAFDPDLTVVYGHSNIAHAIQLIGLMRSEGFDAHVLLEPKTSAFLYLAEWGKPSVAPEFQVEPLPDGNYIAYAKEFDIAFEFETEADMLRFDEMVKQYAKRNAEDQTDLILGSWWQPLYYTTVEADAYIPVKNNVAAMGPFYLQSFSLTEDSDAVAEAFSSAFGEAEVSVDDLWVNEAFHNYLMGEAS